jgi:hypothetical protein
MADVNTRQSFLGFRHLSPKIAARQAKFLLEAWISWLPIVVRLSETLGLPAGSSLPNSAAAVSPRL